MDTSKHHVKNRDLREEIIKSKAQDDLTPEALRMLMLMCTKFAEKMKYIYEEDKKDCIQFAVLDCWQYWRGYDPEKSANAFAYYTQVIKHGFAKGWRKLYGHMPKSSKISISQNQLYNL
jgi:5'-deoxynucleotidase YfbR-like HD superfamily hydrolase